MAFSAQLKGGPESQLRTLPLLSGTNHAERHGGSVGNVPKKILKRPKVSAYSPTRCTPSKQGSRISKTAICRSPCSGGGGSGLAISVDIERAHALAVERTVKALQKKRFLQQRSQEEEMRERQLKTAKAQSKSMERRRLRAEVYAINAFLKEQETLRFAAMMKIIVKSGINYQFCDSGDDSSVSNGSGDEDNRRGVTPMKKKGERINISCGV